MNSKYKNMSENNNSINKINFFLGFFAGLAVISVVGFFVLLGVMFANPSEEKPVVKADEPTEKTQEDPQVKTVRSIDKDDHILGDLDAEVQIIVYDDFECSYCLRHEETLNQIIDTYGDKVVMAYRHFPLSFHANAQKAAEASECAAEQGKFWEMHGKIFESQGNDTMGVAQFKKDAKSLGLNTKKFNDCLDSGKYESEVKSDLSEGVAFGVQGTPGNFVNGQAISGAVSFAQFKTMIDAVLEN
jgi:protein-disulfide isomerase